MIARKWFAMCLIGGMSILQNANCNAESLTPKTPKVPTPTMLSVTDASNEFSIDLYRELCNEKKGNLFFSGYSIATAMLMAQHGAVDDASLQIGELLRLPDEFRTANSHLPWNVGEVAKQNALIEKSLSPGDAAQFTAMKKELSKLESEWESIKPKLARNTERPDYKLIQRENELVDSINQLRSRIEPYQLTIANALWCDKSFKLRPQFLDPIEKFHHGASFSSDFQAQFENERERINGWVSNNTNKRIQNLLPPGSVDQDTRLVLTNAVFFKGEWQNPFTKSQTFEAPFYSGTEGEQKCKMMSTSLTARYAEYKEDGTHNELISVPAKPNSFFQNEWRLPDNPNGFKMIELDYKGDAMSMIILLPNAKDGLSKLEANLKNSSLREAIQGLRVEEANVKLPKFTLRQDVNLVSTFRKMGVNAPFEVNGFTGLSDSPGAEMIVIGGILHQAFVDVNEEGTEAAAATAVVLAARSALPSAPKPTPEFVADHPFLFMIRHKQSESILFMGRFENVP